VQQNDVTPVPIAAPLAPPPDEAHVPASVSVGAPVSAAKAGGEERTEHPLGTVSVVPPEHSGLVEMFTLGDVHVPVEGAAHWHALQPRWSSTPV
jgi:hypothetical protein